MAYVLHQLLTQSAARRPDAEPVRLLTEPFTYRELETRSNQRRRYSDARRESRYAWL